MFQKYKFWIFGLVLIAIPWFSHCQNLTVGGTLDYGSRSNSPFYSSAVLVNVSNTLAETTVASVTIPGGVMGSNGLLRITILGSCDFTNSNSKTWKVKFGGQQVNVFDLTENRAFSKQINIWNTNTPTGQVGSAGTNVSVVSYGSLQGPFFNGSVDTTSSQTVAVTVSNAVATDSSNLESLMVAILPFNTPSLTVATPIRGPNINIRNTLSQFQDGYRPFVNNGIPTTAPALSTAENTVFSTTIPGMAMGSNGTLRITFMTDQTSNANSKYFGIRYGGQLVRLLASNNSPHWAGSLTLSNRNSLTNQVSSGITTSSQSFNQTGMLPANVFVDSSVDQPLICTVSNTVSTDTITGRAFSVEIERAN